MEKHVKFNWLKWGSAVIVMPALVFGPIGNWMVSKISNVETNGLASWPSALVSIVIPVILMVLSVFYWSDGVLRRDWKIWRQHWVKNVFWALVAGVFMIFVLVPVSKWLGGLIGGQNVPLKFNGASALSFGDVAPTMLASLVGLFAPFYEEIVFHHAITEPFANRKWVYAVVSIFSNIMFGIVHINNVNGNWSSLLMYIVMGFWFQFVYLKAGRNIWQNIMTHMVYNGSITLFTIFSMLIVWLMGGSLN